MKTYTDLIEIYKKRKQELDEAQNNINSLVDFPEIDDYLIALYTHEEAPNFGIFKIDYAASGKNAIVELMDDALIVTNYGRYHPTEIDAVVEKMAAIIEEEYGND